MTWPRHHDSIMSRTLWKTVDAASRARSRPARGRHGRREGRAVRPLADPRRRHPRRAAGQRLAPPAAVPRRDEPPSPSATRTSAASRSTSRRRPTASACWRCSSRRTCGSRRRGRARWLRRARPRRRAGPQPAARDHVDHRLRPDRRLSRLAGQRHDPRGDERHPQRSGLAGRDPLSAPPGWRTRRPRSRPHGRRSSPTGTARDRTRGSRRLLHPRGGDADHGPCPRHRVRESRLRLPVDLRAAGGRPLPDLPVRGRLRARRRPGPRQWRATWRGSASRRPSRTSGTTRSRRGSRRPPSSTSSTPRCSPA